MDKSTSFITDFIEVYRQHPALWQVKSDVYSNRKEKEKGYSKLLDLYKTIDESASVDTVKKKINNLRSAFRKELRKVEKSKKSGSSAEEIYNSSLWYYKLLRFTEDQETTRKSLGNDEEEEPEEIQNNETLINSETQQDLCEDDSLSNFLVSPETENFFNEMPRTFSRTSTVTTASSAFKSKKAERDTILEKACTVLNAREDEFDIIGANVAYKLRRMDDGQRVYAEQFINNILFYGIKKQLNDNMTSQQPYFQNPHWSGTQITHFAQPPYTITTNSPLPVTVSTPSVSETNITADDSYEY